MYLPDKLLPLPESETVEPWRRALLDAAALIAEHGWFQMGPSHKSEGGGSFCAATALNEMVVQIDMSKVHLRQKIRREFVAHIGGQCWADIMRWNDVPERTKEDVIRALTDCARS